MPLQTVLVPRDMFTLAEARRWVKNHNYLNANVDMGSRFYRFRQRATPRSAHYYTYVLPNGVHLVLYE